VEPRTAPEWLADLPQRDSDAEALAAAAALSTFVRCDSRRAGAHRCLTCLDGEAGGPQEDGALLAHGTGWMSPYQGDRYFEYGVLDRA
jgi:hypothetical protein